MKKLLNPYSAVLIFLVFLLGIFGILISASLNIVYSGIMLRQVLSFFIGIVVMLFFSFLNHKVYEKLAKISYIIMFILLLYVLLSRSVSRFIDFGFFAIQPSQFAYIVISLLIARIFKEKINDNELPKVFFVSFILVTLIAILIAFEPDMGSAAEVFLTGFFLLIIVGMPFFEIVLLSLIAGFGVLLLIPLNSEWRRRIEAFLNPYAHAESDALQTLQSLRAFARGGLTGVGFMRGIFKYPTVLPVSISDFILPVIGEEFGAIFVILIVLVYLLIAYVGFKISNAAQSLFSRILALGLTLGILFWAVINIAVSLGLMPTTGVPLPFVSFGGNNMIANFIAVGILINISRKEVEE